MKLIKTGERAVIVDLSAEDCRLLAVACDNFEAGDTTMNQLADMAAAFFDTAGLSTLIYTYTNEERLTIRNWRAGEVGGDGIRPLASTAPTPLTNLSEDCETLKKHTADQPMRY